VSDELFRLHLHSNFLPAPRTPARLHNAIRPTLRRRFLAALRGRHVACLLRATDIHIPENGETDDLDIAVYDIDGGGNSVGFGGSLSGVGGGGEGVSEWDWGCDVGVCGVGGGVFVGRGAAVALIIVFVLLMTEIVSSKA
jgi:hypothetical protein